MDKPWSFDPFIKKMVLKDKSVLPLFNAAPELLTAAKEASDFLRSQKVFLPALERAISTAEGRKPQ